MQSLVCRAVALAVLLLALAVPATTVPANAAATPQPMPTIRFSKVPLHTEFVVQVNKKGQIVRVVHGKSCPNLTFNAQTYGNVLQMWIRHPDGTAQVGTYKVTYDYDPKSRGIYRGVALLSLGGNWGDKIGAATDMINIANREAAKGATPKPNLPALNILTATPRP